LTKPLHVVGVGNAIVDVIASIEDGFLAANNVTKGIMQRIDGPRAVDLYSRMGPAREVSGGSAANTVAGLAALDMRTAYAGKVKDDQLGEIFAHDLRAQAMPRRWRRGTIRRRPGAAWCWSVPTASGR
jgi:sugar/nucleoside kinase (ribokinase family)